MYQAYSALTSTQPEVKSLRPKPAKPIPKRLKYIVLQFENEGAEYKIEKTDSGRNRVRKTSYLETLYNSSEITHEEFSRVVFFQKCYEKSNKSNHARPSLIYEGLPRSATSGKPFEEMINVGYLEACAHIRKVSKLIEEASAPRQISGFKEFKNFKINHRKMSQDKRYLDILKYLFAQAKTITKCEELTGINHNTIKERALEICKILLKVD